MKYFISTNLDLINKINDCNLTQYLSKEYKCIFYYETIYNQDCTFTNNEELESECKFDPTIGICKFCLNLLNNGGFFDLFVSRGNHYYHLENLKRETIVILRFIHSINYFCKIDYGHSYAIYYEDFDRNIVNNTFDSIISNYPKYQELLVNSSIFEFSKYYQYYMKWVYSRNVFNIYKSRQLKKWTRFQNSFQNISGNRFYFRYEIFPDSSLVLMNDFEFSYYFKDASIYSSNIHDLQYYTNTDNFLNNQYFSKYCSLVTKKDKKKLFFDYINFIKPYQFAMKGGHIYKEKKHNQMIQKIQLRQFFSPSTFCVDYLNLEFGGKLPKFIDDFDYCPKIKQKWYQKIWKFFKKSSKKYVHKNITFSCNSDCFYISGTSPIITNLIHKFKKNFEICEFKMSSFLFNIEDCILEDDFDYQKYTSFDFILYHRFLVWKDFEFIKRRDDESNQIYCSIDNWRMYNKNSTRQIYLDYSELDLNLFFTSGYISLNFS